MIEKQLPLSDVNILIIDDSLIFSRRLETYFIRQGAAALVIFDGYQVSDALEYFQPDIIFLNYTQETESLLQQLAQGPWSCIAMSEQNNLELIRSALNNGALDFVFKIGCDYEQLPNIILSSLQQKMKVEENEQRAELRQHFEFLQTNDVAASQLLMQMLPESGILLGRYLYTYQLQGSSILPLVMDLDEHYSVVVIADLGLLGEQVSVAAVILNSLLKAAWHAYQQKNDLTAIEPHLMMEQLNNAFIDSQLRQSVGVFYSVWYHGKQCWGRGVNAGLLELESPFKQVELGIGLFKPISYLSETRPVTPSGIYFSFHNHVGDRLTMKLMLTDEYIKLA